MKSRLYYKWHLSNLASPVHWAVLTIFVAAAAGFGFMSFYPAQISNPAKVQAAYSMSFVVSGAGAADYNGTYSYAGVDGSGNYYYQLDGSHTISYVGGGGGFWHINGPSGQYNSNSQNLGQGTETWTPFGDPGLLGSAPTVATNISGSADIWTVSGAGCSIYNGTYTELNYLADGHPVYINDVISGIYLSWNESWNSYAGAWNLGGPPQPGSMLTQYIDGSTLPGTWTNPGGETACQAWQPQYVGDASPAPTVTAYSPPAGITISGTAKQYDETTNAPDSETVKVAINGSLQAQTGTTSSGTWSISGVTAPSAGDTITVFIDGVADSNEANAVTKYDGTGDITGVNLFEKHLSLGSDDNQTLSNNDISKYDNSVSGDEDIFFEVDGSNNLTLPATSTQTDTDQKLIIKAGNTWRPASGGGVISTIPAFTVQAGATATLDSNILVITGGGHPLTITGTFNANTSTVKYTNSAATEVADTTYYNLYLDHTGATFTAAGDITVNGVFTINAGTFAPTSHTITLAGSGTPFVLTGTFTEGTSTIKYTGASATNITPTTYYNLTTEHTGTNFTFIGNTTASHTFTNTTAPSTLTFHSGSTYAFNTVNIAGSAGNLITLAPSGGTNWTLNPTTVTGVSYVDVSRSTNTGTPFCATHSTDSGNNISWNISTGDSCLITISGTAKQWNGTTNTVDGETVKVAVNGVLQAQTGTTGTPSAGTWSISGVTAPAAGDTITVFIDGVADANKSNAVTKYDGSGDITGMYLPERHVSLGSDDNQTISNADMSKYDNSVSGDADIMFDVDGSNNLSIPVIGRTLLIRASNTYRPSGAGGVTTTVPAFAILVGATASLDSNTFVITNDGFSPNGTFNADTSTFKYIGPSQNIINSLITSITYYNLYFDNASSIFTTTADITVNGVLTINAGTFAPGAHTITLAGSGTPLVVTGTFSEGTSTFKYTGSGATNVASTTYYNLNLDHTGTTFTGAGNITVGGDIALSTGTFSPGSYTIYVAGNWNNTGGTFTKGTSTVNFNGTAAGKTITSGGQSFNNLAFDGSGGEWTLQDDLVAGSVHVIAGKLIDNAKNVTVNGNILIDDVQNLLLSTGSWSLGANGSIGNECSGANYQSNIFNSLTIKSGVTATLAVVNTKKIILEDSALLAGTKLQISPRADNFFVQGAGSTVSLTGTGGSSGMSIIGGSWIQNSTFEQGSIDIPNTYLAITYGKGVVYKMTSSWVVGRFYIEGEFSANAEDKATTLDTNGYNLTNNGNFSWGETRVGVPDGFYAKVLFKTGSHHIAGNVNANITQPLNTHGYLDLGSANISVGGNIDFGYATVTPGTSTVILSGTGAQTITSASQAFYNLTSTNASASPGVTFADVLGVTHLFKDITPSSVLTFTASTSSALADIQLNGGAVGTRVVVRSTTTTAANWNVVAHPQADVSYVDASYNDASSGSEIVADNGTNNDGGHTTHWLFTAPPITISGIAKQYNESSNATDSETVKVAINGTLQAQTGTTSGGTWSIAGVTAPSSGGVITVFIDGATESHRANAVTKYTGSSDITGVSLFEQHLAIGNGTTQTLSNTDISQYDGSVSSDADLLFDVNNSTNDLTMPYNQPTLTSQILYVSAVDTFRPNSSSGITSTIPNLKIPASATVNLDGITLVLTASGDPLSITGTLTIGTSTIKFQGASATNVNAITYNNLVADHTGVTFKAVGVVTISGTLSINSGSTYNSQDYNTTIGTLANNGTWKMIGDQTVTITNMDTTHGTVLYYQDNGLGNSLAAGYTYNNLLIENGFRGVSHALQVNGDMTCKLGTIDTNSSRSYAISVNGSLSINHDIGPGCGTKLWNSVISVGGDYTQTGRTPWPDTSTVVLTGSGSHSVNNLYPFYNLTINGSSTTSFSGDISVNHTFTDTASSSVLTFHSGSTYNFANINIHGSSGQNILLRSSADGSQWLLNVPQTDPTVSYVDAKDSNAASGSEIDASDCTSTDSGNNQHWKFCVPPPADFRGSNVTTSQIEWVWTNTDNDRTSWVVEDVNSNALSPSLPASASSWLEQSLSPNMAYTRHVKVVYKNGSESSNSATVYTLANAPLAPTLTAVSANSINITVGQNGNSPNTLYTIYNDTVHKYVRHSDGAFQDNPDWQLYSDWGGDAGFLNTGLQPGTSYSYEVKARNGDNVETSFSSTSTATTQTSPGSAVSSIVITPSTITLKLNEAFQFNAKAYSSDNNEITSAMIAWSAVNGGGAIDQNGLFTAGSDTGTFENTVEASVGDVKASATVIVRKNTITENIINNIESVAKQIEKVYAALGISKEAAPPITSAVALGLAGVAMAMAPLATAASLYSLSEFFHIITYSILAVGTLRRKRKRWGTVIENGTGLPLAFATVSLIKVDDTGTEKVIETSLTDKNGVYGFAAEPGQYRVIAKKDKYTVDSPENQYFDFNPKKIYNLTSYDEGLIIPTIVMHITGEKLKGLAVTMAWFKKMEPFFIYLSMVILILGTILAVNNIIHTRNALNYIILAGYLLLWVINVSLLIRRSPWSTVVELDGGHPVPLTLVRIMNKDNSKLVRTTMSDQNGKFSAVLKKGRYSISGTREGYSLVKPVIFHTDENLDAFNKKLEMKKNFANPEDKEESPVPNL